MTSDPDVVRRIVRLENDRDSLYELIDDFRAETRDQFDRIESRLDGHDRRFDRIEGRLDAHHGRFDRIEGRLDAHHGRFDRIECSLAEILRRLPETG